MQVTGSNITPNQAQEIIKTIQLVPDGFYFSVASSRQVIHSGRIAFDLDGANIELYQELCRENNISLKEPSAVRIILPNSQFVATPAQWDTSANAKEWLAMAGIKIDKQQTIIECRHSDALTITTTLNSKLEQLFSECYNLKISYIHPVQIMAEEAIKTNNATLIIRAEGSTAYAVGSENGRIKFILPCRFDTQENTLFTLIKLQEEFSAKPILEIISDNCTLNTIAKKYFAKRLKGSITSDIYTYNITHCNK